MDDLRDKYLTAIMAAEDEVALEDLRLQAVGKKGEVSLKMRELGKMTLRPEIVLPHLDGATLPDANF